MAGARADKVWLWPMIRAHDDEESVRTSQHALGVRISATMATPG